MLEDHCNLLEAMRIAGQEAVGFLQVDLISKSEDNKISDLFHCKISGCNFSIAIFVEDNDIKL